MLRHNNNKKDQNYLNISKDNFLAYSMEIYKFIKPKFYGIPTVSVMKKGLKRFAKSINLEFKSYELINPSNAFQTVQFIKRAMTKNKPVMMITWNTNTKNLKNHWVTITGYYKDLSGENFVVTSNWGRKEVFSIDKWLEDRSVYKGLLYFNISSKN